jgi:hypothetical protein
MVAGEALGVSGKQLVSHSPLSKGNRRKLPSAGVIE